MTSKQNDKMQNAKHAKIKLPTQSMLRAQKYHKRMKRKHMPAKQKCNMQRMLAYRSALQQDKNSMTQTTEHNILQHTISATTDV